MRYNIIDTKPFGAGIRWRFNFANKRWRNASEMLKTIKISELVPFDKNPRKNDEAVDSVLESLKATGYVAPIIVNEIGYPFENHVIVAGHTRWKALKT